jgi:hypothetical protein
LAQLQPLRRRMMAIGTAIGVMDAATATKSLQFEVQGLGDSGALFVWRCPMPASLTIWIR